MFGFISKDKALEWASKAYQEGLKAGFEFGKITSKADALGMGYILKGTRMEQEIDQILKEGQNDN